MCSGSWRRAESASTAVTKSPVLSQRLLSISCVRTISVYYNLVRARRSYKHELPSLSSLVEADNLPVPDEILEIHQLIR